MRYQLITKLVFTLLSLVLFLTARPQDLLDSAYVSVNRLEVKQYEAGKNITVIKSQEIQNLPVTSVDELLRYVAGVNLNTRAAFGVQSDIGMRGSTFSQVLILVDNQRINDPLTAHFNNNIPIPLSEIHHIEIVRGAAAASFGADAVGGVIHIKTKAFVNLFDNDEKFGLNGNISVGEYNLTQTDIGVFEQKAKFGYSGAIKTVSSVGEQHVNPNRATRPVDSLYRNFFDLKTYTMAATYRHKDFKLYTRFGGDFREFSAKYFYTISDLDESIEKVNSYWSQIAAQYDGAKSTTFLTAAYRNNKDSFAFNPAIPANLHTTQRINATLLQNRKVFGFNLSYGAQFDWQDIVSTDRGDHTTPTYAAFILTHNEVGKVRANGGFRFEYSENIGLQMLPQLNVSIPGENYVIRSSIGRTIRQGDFTERFTSYNIPNLTPGRNAGNPDLEAETALSYDLGIDAYLPKNIKLSSTLYARNSRNLIDYSLTPSSEISNLPNLLDSASYLYALNIGEAFTWGNELSIQQTTELKNGKLEFVLNHTLAITTTSDSIVSKYISNHPIHNVAGQVVFNHKFVTFTLGANYLTRNAERVASINGSIEPNYLLLNAKLQLYSKDVSGGFFIEARNFTNNQYQEILGAQLPGRWILGGINWNINRVKVKSPIIFR
jgi:vitamin B12 transporter